MSESPKICTVCNLPLVPGCANEYAYDGHPAGGIIFKVNAEGDTYGVTCPNIFKISMRKYLSSIHPDLVQVEHIRNSLVDRIKENLFFDGVHWQTFLRHFKWVAAFKGSPWSAQFVTDLDLISVYVGSTNYRSRPVSDRDAGKHKIYNSLDDLLCDADLTVFRIGLIEHQNKAAANVLAEALSLRHHLGKPSWVVRGSDVKGFIPFMNGGMVSCNDNVKDFVDKVFEMVTLTNDPKDAPVAVYTEDEEDGTVSVGKAFDLEERDAAVPEEDGPTEVSGEPSDADLDGLMGGSNKKRFKKRGNFGR